MGVTEHTGMMSDNTVIAARVDSETTNYCAPRSRTKQRNISICHKPFYVPLALFTSQCYFLGTVKPSSLSKEVPIARRSTAKDLFRSPQAMERI